MCSMVLATSTTGIWYLVHGNWYLVPGNWYLVPGRAYLGTWYLDLVWYLVPGTQVPGTLLEDLEKCPLSDYDDG